MAERPDPTSSKPPLVGFEADMNEIMKAMLDPSVQQLSVVDIVGCRGVGKTYLAKEIYTSAEVQKHFDVHVWLSFANDSFQHWPAERRMSEQLSIGDGANISNFLRGKRYCVVIDDHDGDNYDSRKAWSDILRELPDNNNGSRVLVTRRPGYADCWDDPPPLPILPYEVKPRSNKQSLQMLRAAFSKDPWEGCPAGEVDRLEKKFVRKCEGLPWPLRYLGGLLSELPWDEVLNEIEVIEAHMISFVDLAMSYRDLPDFQHKEAFLYFLTFPEDVKIHAKALVPMLEAEGIIEMSGALVRNDILEYLAKRTLIINVTERYSDGSIKWLQLTDPLHRLLAIHEAKEKRFIWSNDTYIIDLFDAEELPLNMVKRNHKFGGKFMNVAQLADAGCIFNFGENFPLETPLMSNKVLEIDDTKTNVDVVREVKKRGQLKYLGLSNSRLFSEILEFIGSDQHLTSLVVRDPNFENLPSNELMKMISLQHLFLRNTEVSEIPELPYLNTLDVRDTPIGNLPEWIGTSKLISLILRNTKVREISKLPESLVTLDIGGTAIETLPDASFCPNLTTIVLKNTKVREIPESYTKLEYLDARNTFLRSLPYSIWRKLKSVFATDTLQHLDGPPTSLKENNRIINRGRRDVTSYRLETLETVHVTKDWAKSIPNFTAMEKLGLSYFQNDLNPKNELDWNIIIRMLGGLKNLSSLKIQGSNVPPEIFNVWTCPSYEYALKNLSVGGSYSLFSLRDINLPPSLITLRLDNLEFDEDPMPILGKLQYLESLQLRWLLYSPEDKMMTCSDGQWSQDFPELQRLQLSHISGLEELSAKEVALPSITHIIIEGCRDLKYLSNFLLYRIQRLEELHLIDMPTGFTNLFSGLPFVKITKNQI